MTSDTPAKPIGTGPAMTSGVPAATGLDLDLALSRLGGNLELFTQIADAFAIDSVTMIDDLRRHLQAGAESAARAVLHTLRGLTGTLGARSLVELIAGLESRLPSAGDPGDIDTKMRELATLVAATNAALINALNHFRTPAAGGDSLVRALPSPEFEPTALAAALDEIEDLLRGSHMRATEVFGELRQRLGTPLGDRLAPLGAAVDQLDFKRALLECRALPRPARMMSASPPAPSDRPAILVVDDQPSNIRILYEMLKGDYDVYIATSGQDALAFCSSRLPDLILLDVVMADMGGYEVCRRLKANEPTQEVRIIFVTAQNDPLEEARGLDEGAVDFISKPLHEKVVRARVRTHVTLTRQTEMLRSLAMIDGLTGVPNRRRFDVLIDIEWRRCTRAYSPLSLIMIDIDFFKRYNDRYGHQAGDGCIKAVASALQSALRRSHDVVARYGGEEFVCILPDTPIEGAQSKAKELEAAVRALGIPHESSDVASVVTISVGVAVASPPLKGDDPAILIEAADRQLYAAKQAGRGQVCVSSLTT